MSRLTLLYIDSTNWKWSLSYVKRYTFCIAKKSILLANAKIRLETNFPISDLKEARLSAASL